MTAQAACSNFMDCLEWLAAKNLLAAMVQLVAAAIAISGVYLTVRNTRRNQFIKQAHDAYQAFTKDALDSPKLATGHVEIPASYDVASDEFFKYEWLIARLLNAGEQILELLPDDKAWRDTIGGQLVLHKKYFASRYFRNVEFRMYSDVIQDLICDAVGQEACAELRRDNG